LRPESPHIQLPSRLDFGAVEQLHARLRSARHHDCVLDLSAVTYVSALGIQLLAVTVSRWRADQKNLSFTGRTAQFCDSLKCLGADFSTLLERG
tara:strand:- start:7477 stop:7758 length:282 start_codon:yes stop_codon:yes gene_type:complete